VDYNGSTIPVKNFQQYVDLYIGPKQDAKRYESPANAGSTLWSVAHAPVRADLVCQRIATFGAGNTDYILGQITRKMAAFIEKKKKINEPDQGAVDSVPAVRY
jgi:hypothetical protein